MVSKIGCTLLVVSVTAPLFAVDHTIFGHDCTIDIVQLVLHFHKFKNFFYSYNLIVIVVPINLIRERICKIYML